MLAISWLTHKELLRSLWAKAFARRKSGETSRENLRIHDKELVNEVESDTNILAA